MYIIHNVYIDKCNKYALKLKISICCNLSKRLQ